MLFYNTEFDVQLVNERTAAIREEVARIRAGRGHRDADRPRGYRGMFAAFDGVILKASEGAQRRDAARQARREAAVRERQAQVGAGR
ncbi:MAG: hypothetical protein HYX53_07735 [Chloroflexi bacterium]|nr:hypothetical protein [Chloroflexota bacterium]